MNRERDSLLVHVDPIYFQLAYIYLVKHNFAAMFWIFSELTMQTAVLLSLVLICNICWYWLPCYLLQ